eukprot:TRINITY_DN1103_c0_g1_i20.p1 TRINITY_DN1103_c0_g1~~TRINITY_DN1103_c0_g1_i20.p1  ORF type:complete len:243 (-),score=37.99 TRINITY_DN1103_c0_g1_i20:469-1197(-)
MKKTGFKVALAQVLPRALTKQSSDMSPKDVKLARSNLSSSSSSSSSSSDSDSDSGKQSVSRKSASPKVLQAVTDAPGASKGGHSPSSSLTSEFTNQKKVPEQLQDAQAQSPRSELGALQNAVPGASQPEDEAKVEAASSVDIAASIDGAALDASPSCGALHGDQNKGLTEDETKQPIKVVSIGLSPTTASLQAESTMGAGAVLTKKDSQDLTPTEGGEFRQWFFLGIVCLVIIFKHCAVCRF